MENKLNISEEVQLILSIANQLRGPFKEDEYQNVIIPMTICRRFECILEKTKDDVLKEYEEGERNEKALRKISKYCIYNTSKFTLKTLLNDPDNIKSNFVDYLNSFNSTAKDIFTQMKFFDTINQLVKGKKLYVVVKKFAATDLSVEHVNSMQMGYIIEEIKTKNTKIEPITIAKIGKMKVTISTDIVFAKIEELIKEMNEIFNDHELDENTTSGIIYTLIKVLAEDEEVRRRAQNNSPEDFRLFLKDKLEDILFESRKNSNKFFKDALDNDDVEKIILDFLNNIVYNEAREKVKNYQIEMGEKK